MILPTRLFALTVLLLGLAATIPDARAAESTYHSPVMTPLVATGPTTPKGEDSWGKKFMSWLDEYASSKTGFLQIGVLAVLISLYIITRKDGPK